ncbi:hypothetical protein ACWF94_35130 [Streptomyces sp. NPDC055078]
MEHKKAALLAAGVVALGAVGAAAWFATAAPDNTAPATHSGAAASAAPRGTEAGLSEVADRLSALGGPGTFAGLTVDESSRTITSHWVGHAPDEVVAYARSRPEGVRVGVVEGARYNRAVLGAAALRVTSSQAGKAAGVTSASARPDGSGLDVGVAGRKPGVEAAAEIARVAGIPTEDIAYEEGKKLVKLPARVAHANTR